MPKGLLLLLAVVMAAVVVVYKFPGASPLSFSPVRGVAAVGGAPPAVPEPVQKSRRDPASARAKATPGEGSNSASTQPTILVEVIPSAPKASTEATEVVPFPTPETLKKGTPAPEIVARFGSPDFDVAGTSDGRVIETFYYVSRDRTQLTVVSLQNGVLTAIDSRSSPYFQLRGAKPRVP